MQKKDTDLLLIILGYFCNLNNYEMIIKHKKLLLFFVVTVLFLSCKPQNKETSEREIFENENVEVIIDTIPFTMDEKYPSPNFNKILIPVQLKDHKSYIFILDNGHLRTSIRSDVFNSLYDISTFSAVDTMLSITASRITFEGHVEIAIGNYIFSIDTLLIGNKERLDKISPSHSLYKGFIGFDLFARKIVEIDFDQKLVFLHTLLPEKSNTYLAIDLIYRKQQEWTKWNEREPRIQLDGFLGKNREKLTGEFWFDLGAPITHLYPQFKDKLLLDISQYDTTLLGYKLLSLTNVHNIRIGGYAGSEIYTSEPLGDEHNQGVIGMDFLKNFNLIFDYQGDKLYLKQRENVEESPMHKIKWHD